jgi:hypothetical protein
VAARGARSPLPPLVTAMYQDPRCALADHLRDQGFQGGSSEREMMWCFSCSSERRALFFRACVGPAPAPINNAQRPHCEIRNRVSRVELMAHGPAARASRTRSESGSPAARAGGRWHGWGYTPPRRLLLSSSERLLTAGGGRRALSSRTTSQLKFLGGHI